MKKNNETIKNFGDEWKKFSQSNLTNDEVEELYERYFSVFPIDKLSNKSIGFDLGCGSGRFSKYFAEKVKNLHCIEPSDAINVAKKIYQNIKILLSIKFLSKIWNSKKIL